MTEPEQNNHPPKELKKSTEALNPYDYKAVLYLLIASAYLVFLRDAKVLSIPSFATAVQSFLIGTWLKKETKEENQETSQKFDKTTLTNLASALGLSGNALSLIVALGTLSDENLKFILPLICYLGANLALVADDKQKKENNPNSDGNNLKTQALLNVLGNFVSLLFIAEGGLGWILALPAIQLSMNSFILAKLLSDSSQNKPLNEDGGIPHTYSNRQNIPKIQKENANKLLPFIDPVTGDIINNGNTLIGRILALLLHDKENKELTPDKLIGPQKLEVNSPILNLLATFPSIIDDTGKIDTEAISYFLEFLATHPHITKNIGLIPSPNIKGIKEISSCNPFVSTPSHDTLLSLIC
jgi:hypothetical protein